MKLGYRIKQLMLSGGDLLSFFVGFWLSLATRTLAMPTWPLIERNISLFFVVFLFWIVINYINGLYDLERLDNTKNFYRRFFETALISLTVGIIFFYLLPGRTITPKTILLLNIGFGYAISAFWRFLYNSLVGEKALRTRVLFIGFREETVELIELLKNNPKKGYEVVGIVTMNEDDSFPNIEHLALPVYKGSLSITTALAEQHPHTIILAPHLRKHQTALKQLYELLFSTTEIMDLVSFYEGITGRIPPFTFSEEWFIDHLRNREKPIYDHFRTLLDYIFALVVGLVSIILFPIIAILVKSTSTGPLIIKQQRVGKNGKLFTLYKFRSMYALNADGTAEIDGVEFAVKKDKRITPVGNILRKTRLDELPQVWNLLKRDVTLIGPRPERPEITQELELQMPFYPLRHVVRPGLTSLAVLHQNYTDTMESSLQKLQYDLYYIKNRSLLLDLVIALRTINVIIRAKGQ